MATTLSSVPSENWDDDFEFQGTNPRNSPVRNRLGNYNTNVSTNPVDANKNTIHGTFHDFEPKASDRRMSTVSSHLTMEDWDAESSQRDIFSSNPGKRVFEDKKNIDTQLSDWAEPGPSTPPKRLSTQDEAENWDDDFEDKDSPTKKGVGSPRKGSASTKSRALRLQKRIQQPEEPQESWDDEFGLSKRTPRNKKQHQNTSSPSSHKGAHRRPQRDYTSSDSDASDDEKEFGFADRDEEDKTVTVRSRRAALSRLTGSSSSTATAHPSPPPPVPALPSAFLNHNINTNLSSSPTQPFPRSPTASVFSVPTTVADSHSITSTTRLRPSISRSSGSVGLARLPPSPPIHKGRRLRKKSRPAPQGVFELSNMRYPYQPGAYQYSFSDGEVDGKGRASVDEPRTSGGSRPSSTISIGRDVPLGIVIPPATPSRGSKGKNATVTGSGSATPATPLRNNKKATSPKNATPSSSTKGSATLLSRIGSVKRWGVARRARGSSMTPSEVAAAGTLAEGPSDSEHQLTPRPQSSLSSLHHSSSHQSSPSNPTPPHANPPSTSNWFFRASSGSGSPLGGTSHRPYNGGSPHRPVGSHSRAGSMTDLDLRDKMYTPSPDRPAPGQILTPIQDSNSGNSNSVNTNVTSTTTPSKLIKRKSLGFVQLRRGFGGHGGGTVDLPPSNGTSDSHEPHIQPRHTSYGGLGLGRAGGEDVKERDEGDRDRKRSISRSGKELFSFGDDKGSGLASEKWRDVKEGNRGFMGNVRKISLVGRHKRAKSGVPLVGGTENLDSLGEGSGTVQRPARNERRRPSGDRRRPSVGDTSRSDASAARGPSVDELRRLSVSGSRPSTSDGRRRSVDGKPRPSIGDGRRPSVGDVRRPSMSEVRRPSTESRKHTDVPKTPPRLPQPLLPPIELQPPSPPRLKGKPSVSLQGTNETSTGSEAMLSPSTSSLSLMLTPKRTPSIKFATSATKSSSITPGTSSSSVMPTSPPRSSSSPVKTPASPQSASLGRSAGPATVNATGSGTAFVPRRNSLGDLKIPARITQAQVGLRRDLEMVREFAINVEQLKEMQATYHSLVGDVQRILDSHAQLHIQQQQQPQVRATSPSFFKPLSRRRASTNPDNMAPSPSQIAYKDLASAFYTINSRYCISWECAELLIELGGTGGSSETGPSTSTSAPAVFRSAAIAMSEMHVKKGRDRAITLASESKPPTPTPGSSSHIAMNNAPPLANSSSLAWRTSTGKNDLSHRQLNLLREMLSRGEPLVNEEDLLIPEEPPTTLHVNRDWRWGDPMSSTVTLPSEEGISGAIQSKKRRSSRLGLTGLRDMLRSLKRSTAEQPSPPIPPIPASSTSLSTDSSFDNRSCHRYPHALVPHSSRRRAKTSMGPEDMPSMKQNERPVSPYAPSSFSARASPRRPSLASIFRLGLKHKITPPHPGDTSMDSSDSNYNDVGRNSNSTGEEDWDQIDAASDLDAAARGLELGHDGSATVRGSKGRSPYLHRDPYAPPLPRSITSKRSASGSQTSLYGESLGARPRSTRLSNVEEHGDQRRPTRTSSKRHSKTGVSPSRPTSRLSKLHQNGSIRSMPPQPVSAQPLDPKLALTPENIKPLLENAKEIHVRLGECISEIRALLPAQL